VEGIITNQTCAIKREVTEEKERIQPDPANSYHFRKKQKEKKCREKKFRGERVPHVLKRFGGSFWADDVECV